VQNPYLPYPVRIDEIITETEDKNLKTFKFVFLDPKDEEKFAYKAGQFAELSVTGKGEIPIGIASSPTEKGFVKFTVNKVGLVSTYLHSMKVGDIMGLRGPLGNSYPWETLEGKSVVIIGGKIAACQLAEFLVKRGRKVTIVDEEETFGEGLVPERKNRLLYWFGKKGVTILTGVTCEEITNEGLTVRTRTGERLTLAADAIIPATPLLPNTAVAETIRGKVSEVHLIGDCENPRLIVDAVAGGWKVARDL